MPPLKEKTCRICGSTADHRIYNIPEMMFGTGELFPYFQCGSCGCLQIASIPHELSKYYPDNYYSFSQSDVKRPVVKRISDRVKIARDRAVVLGQGWTAKLWKGLSGGGKLLYLGDLHLSTFSRILDVGCGTGGRLQYLRELGFSQVMGIDPFLSRDIDNGNGVRILKKSISEMSGTWDVVMFHHSLEHVSDPIDQLRSAAALLSPGGACIIRIPTVASFAWEQYREYWYQADAPRHLFIPSLEGMQILAKSSGLKLVRTEFDSTLEQFRISECYRKGIRFGETRGVFPQSRIRKWKKQAKALNRSKMGDQAVFTLIKEQQ